MFYGMASLPDPPLMFGPLLATYTLAAYRPRRMSLPILALLIVGSALAILGGDASDAADVVVGLLLRDHRMGRRRHDAHAA